MESGPNAKEIEMGTSAESPELWFRLYLKSHTGNCIIVSLAGGGGIMLQIGPALWKIDSTDFCDSVLTLTLKNL